MPKRPTATLSERLERIGRKLIATTEFSQDAHAVLEAAVVLSERVPQPPMMQGTIESLRSLESNSEALRLLKEEVVEAAKGWLSRYEDEVRDPSEEYPCKRLVAALDALLARADKGNAAGRVTGNSSLNSSSMENRLDLPAPAAPAAPVGRLRLPADDVLDEYDEIIAGVDPERLSLDGGEADFVMRVKDYQLLRNAIGALKAYMVAAHKAEDAAAEAARVYLAAPAEVPTPETNAVDAVADQNYGTDMYRDMLEHARRLERQRDAAREIAVHVEHLDARCAELKVQSDAALSRERQLERELAEMRQARARATALWKEARKARTQPEANSDWREAMAENLHLQQELTAAIERERLANKRANDIPTIIRRSTWRTPDLRESAARLVANILRDDDDPHPPVPPDHFPVA